MYCLNLLATSFLNLKWKGAYKGLNVEGNNRGILYLSKSTLLQVKVLQ